MTRIVSKFGIAAALTLGMLSTAAAQVRTPTKTIPVTKSEPGEVVTVHDTVTKTVMVHDTVTRYVRDTLRLTGATVTHYDTARIVSLPGWMDRGNGLYFGLGAGPSYPSAGLGGGQIPGYTAQLQAGVDPAGSPLGFRVTAAIARPDEAQDATAPAAGRPSIMNFTGDLKLTLPMFKQAAFPMFSLYGVGGVAAVAFKDLRLETDAAKVVTLPEGNDHKWHGGLGYDVGAGAQLQLGHQRQLFLEGRFINFFKTGYESNHQWPIVLGINWY